MKAAASQRQMLHSALVASADSLAQAQAGIEADEELSTAGDAVASTETKKRDALSEALRACAGAERAAAAARDLLDRPLDREWFRAVSGGGDGVGSSVGAAEEEELVAAAQRAAAQAEGAAARLMERLGQVRGIRAKLRYLLSSSEARFRRASAALADAGLADDGVGADQAVRVASTALTRARDRLRTPLGSGYLMSGAGGYSGGYGGGLAKDEEAVSEAQGYVTALEMLTTSTAKEADSPESGRAHEGQTSDRGVNTRAPRGVPAADGVSKNAQNAARDALTLAMQWGEALRTQVSELELEGDPAVAQAIEAAGNAMRVVKTVWSASDTSERGSGAVTDGRSAVEGLAAELERLEKATENAAESRRAREAGLGMAARRLDRLMATLTSLERTVRAAGEPLVSLTAEAMRAAYDAASTAAGAAAAASGAGTGSDKSKATSASPKEVALVDAVQAAAVAVAQAEATVTRARERASQVSAERVRALETLVALAETLREAGDRLASSSAERGLVSSREAAAAIAEAQTALGKARAAAQVGAEDWLSGAAVIAEAVAEAGELVRLAKRSADGPAVVRPATLGRNAPSDGATDEAVARAGANAQAWLEAEAGLQDEATMGDSGEKKGTSPVAAGGVRRGSARPATGGVHRKPRIGFSDKGEGAPAYMPLWMHLRKKVWDAAAGGTESGPVGGGGDEQLEADGASGGAAR